MTNRPDSGTTYRAGGIYSSEYAASDYNTRGAWSQPATGSTNRPDDGTTTRPVG